MLGVRMKRIMGSGVFWGTVVLFAAIMAVGAYEDLPTARANSMSVLYLYVVTTTIGIANVLVPVITIIPFAFFYVEELEKKAVYYNLIRCSKRSYYLSNIAAAVLSSILVSAFALALFVCVCLAFGAGLETSGGLESFFEQGIFLPWLRDGRHIFVLLVKFLAFLLFSAPWGMLCLVISVFCRNKYVIVAFPFIIEVLLSYSTQGSPLYLLDPGLTLLVGPIQGMAGGGIIYALCYHGGLTAVLSILYYVMSKRRYRHEGI